MVQALCTKQKLAVLMFVIMLCFVLPITALADRIEGETVVTLGQDLTSAQQEQILADMGVSKDEVEILYVTNQEEYHYLGDYISAAQIGSKAISSTKITLTPEGSGIHVKTSDKITWVTEEMLANSLATAGVTDADVYVTAPFNVSGTAGLTGLIKAFEAATDTEISEEQKQVANEEVVRQAELAEKIGAAEAAELIRRLKEALADTKLETDEDYRNLVKRVAQELNVELSEQDIDAIVHLLKRLKDLNIDWNQVSQQLKHIRDNLDEILNREETKNFIRQIIDFIISLIEQIKALFAK